MRWLLLLVSLGLTACYSNDGANVTDSAKTEAQIQVEQAVSQSDFRFYATQGRRTTYPGLDEQADSQLLAKCGHQFLTGTGDVLRSPEDKIARKQKVAFATEYNKLMKAYCESSQ